jgi:KRAB domain-containing zinc finger protein
MGLIYLKNENNEYYCKSCKFTTINQSTMHYHLKNHLGEYNYKCEDCDKSFIQKATLDLHILSKHSKESSNKYECPECNFTSLTEGNCKIHWMRMHCKNEIKKIKNNLSCNKCSDSFKTLTSFYYHAYNCLDLEIRPY